MKNIVLSFQTLESKKKKCYEILTKNNLHIGIRDFYVFCQNSIFKCL